MSNERSATAKIFKVLSQGSATTREIADITNITYECACSTISRLLRDEKIHIAEWRPSPGSKVKKPAAAWMIGNKESVPRPPPVPRLKKSSQEYKQEEHKKTPVKFSNSIAYMAMFLS